MNSIPLAMVRESLPAPRKVPSLPARRPCTQVAICVKLVLIPSGVMSVVLASAIAASRTDDACHHFAIAEGIFLASDLLLRLISLAGHHHHVAAMAEGDGARDGGFAVANHVGTIGIGHA